MKLFKAYFMKRISLFFLTIAVTFACAKLGKNTRDKDLFVDQEALEEKVLSAEEQAVLSPDMVLEILKSGNDRFASNNITIRNHAERIRKTASAQYPKAVILSCMDSRVPVEDVFDRGLGSLFVLRIAGNIVNEDIVASIEYACKVSGAKLVVVMGHERCGAIEAAVSNKSLGNLHVLISKIQPAIDKVIRQGQVLSDHDIQEATLENIRLSKKNIREQSSLLQQMEQDGQIKIIGAFYEVTTGKVQFL